MKFPIRRFSSRWSTLLGVALGLVVAVLLGGGWWGAAIAQANLPTGVDGALIFERSHVSVDGYELFEVSRAGGFTAAVRGQSISRNLDRELNNRLDSDDPLNVTVEQNEGGTVLRVNGVYIMTVTDRDLTPEVESTMDQGELWRRAIANALERAIENRQPTALLYSAIAMGIAMGIAGVCHLGLAWLGRDQRRQNLRRRDLKNAGNAGNAARQRGGSGGGDGPATPQIQHFGDLPSAPRDAPAIATVAADWGGPSQYLGFGGGV